MVNRHFALEPETDALDKVIDWNDAHSYGDRIILVDDADLSGALGHPGLPTMRLTHWADRRLRGKQRWAPALNAAVAEAALRGYEFVCHISTGVQISAETMEAMLSFMRQEPDVRACGPLMKQHGFFSPGPNPIAGAIIPWNQARLSRVSNLARVWYQGVSDGLIEIEAQGVEEVVADVFAQILIPPSRVVLFRGLPGRAVFEQNLALGADYTTWATDDKYKTKSDRPARQIQLMGDQFIRLAAKAKVWHIDWYDYLSNGAPW